MTYRRENQEEAAAQAGIAREALRSDAKFDDIPFFGGLGGRRVILPQRGDVHQGHCHTYDHITILGQGAVRCEVRGREPKDYTAPAAIPIAAKEWHRFTALADGTIFWCMFVAKDGRDMSGPAITADSAREHFIGGCLSCR